MLPSDHMNISRQKTCQLMSAAASLQAARSNSQDKVYTSYSIVICKKKKIHGRTKNKAKHNLCLSKILMFTL